MRLYAVSLVLDRANKTVKLENLNAFTLSALVAGRGGPKPGEIDVPGESVGQEM